MSIPNRDNWRSLLSDVVRLLGGRLSISKTLLFAAFAATAALVYVARLVLLSITKHSPDGMIPDREFNLVRICVALILCVFFITALFLLFLSITRFSRNQDQSEQDREIQDFSSRILPGLITTANIMRNRLRDGTGFTKNTKANIVAVLMTSSNHISKFNSKPMRRCAAKLDSLIDEITECSAISSPTQSTRLPKGKWTSKDMENSLVKLEELVKSIDSV